MIRTTAYLVECRTGCSCCAEENHWRGPFSSQDAADKAVESFKAMPLLASQFSRTGVYSIRPATCEILDDGRMIIDGDRVCATFVDDVAETDDAKYDY